MKKWVKALRSGKYKQGRRALREENTYCCLGVACDVSKRGKWHEDSGDSPVYSYITGYGPRLACLPPCVVDWLGLKNKSGTFEIPYEYKSNTYNSLVHMNDNGCTFKEIAQAIEDKYEDLINVYRK